MAVEARHRNLFPSQILSNREIMMNGVESNGNMFGYGMVAPPSGTSTATDIFVPMYGSAIDCYKTAAPMKSDSGLTCVPISRKRSREVTDSRFQNHSPINSYDSFTFLGEDISFQIQQQQLEIDRFIANHTDKVILEMESRRERYSRRVAAAVEENIMKKIKTKEEEIEKIGKINSALDEKIKSLCFENQIWRDLARTNEATANALRSNLEQVLSQAEQQQQQRHHTAADLADDAQSCCGSNYEETDGRMLADDGASDCRNAKVNDGCNAPSNNNRMCRNCEKEESCVLLLPCRHLCLCTHCGSTLHTCPVCHSTKTASVHVNFVP